MIKLFKQGMMATLIALMAVLPVLAEEEGAPAGPSVTYTEMRPAFVVNYGGPGRLQYLKADITMVTSSSDATETAEHHMPLVRNELVSLLSRQTEEAVTTPVGQEQMRQEATQAIKELFQQEVGHPVIDDLLFLNFIYQK